MEGVAFALLALFVVRPPLGLDRSCRRGLSARERAVISFFGIRGLGTIYYLAYALNHARFEAPDLLWSTAGLTILISIVLHGMTVTPVMRCLDRTARIPRTVGRRERRGDAGPTGAVSGDVDRVRR